MLKSKNFQSLSTFLLMLTLQGCKDSDKTESLQAPLDYNCTLKFQECTKSQDTDVDNHQRTQAQIENECLEKTYSLRKQEMDTLFDEIISRSEGKIEQTATNEMNENLRKQQEELIDTQQDFNTFLKKYGESQAAIYLRSYNYHLYGSMCDLIDLRIKHLKILAANF